jgi:hypothetical protein
MSRLDYRTGRNNPTPKELAARRRLTADLKKYSEEPFPNGAKILFNHDGTKTKAYWDEWGLIEPTKEIWSY